MSRDGGFAIGDRSTRTLYDVRLVRATRLAGLGVIVAWDAILDASWEAGERISFDDAVDTLPYDLGDTTAIRDALASVCLLDDDGLIRVSSWDLWFGVAYARREATRERGRRYNASRRIDADSTSGARRNDVARPTIDGDSAPPSVPTGPTDRSSPSRAPAREAPSRNGATEEAAVAARAVVASLGFHPVPKPTRAKRP